MDARTFPIALPLQGIRVLDFTRVIAGPYCTQMLGDMGAEVIKIEQPGKGDDSRKLGPPFVQGESAYFLSFNRNKKSLALDLGTPPGRELIYRLVAQSDVVVDNFRPGVGQRLGIGYEALREIHPGIVVCSISAFGHSGPFREEPGYDITLQAISGTMSLTGEPGRAPVKIGIPIGDLAGGMFAAYGIVNALYARQQTGQGQFVDISLFDCQLALLSYMGGYYLMGGVVPQPVGTGHPNLVPYQAFKTQDGYLIVAIFTEDFWRQFCQALERPELLSDPRFVDNAHRAKHRQELIPILEAIMAERTTEAWCQRLQGMPVAPLNTVDKALEHPQAQAREMVVPLQHPQCEEIRVLGNPIKMDSTWGQGFDPPPLLGQHTAEILSDRLGLSREEIEALGQAGVVQLKTQR
ncbi:MAG: CoA transferase [Candidatus Tectomicrobia bacterium]|uniref:CoA transferase n=1 Tax=Tectimicrobiota bacterium TaxID=2528274 RepID=A0A932CLE7_UNCTE|nr:CoA transferase [Candidatus Tectomicrobia bacterium]